MSFRPDSKRILSEFWSMTLIGFTLLMGSCGSKDGQGEVDCGFPDLPAIEGLLVSPTQIKNFVGCRGGVLVWVEMNGSPRMLDFRKPDPKVQALSQDTDWVNPLISPDGSRLVFSQGMPNGPKFINVRPLDGGQVQRVATGDIGYWNAKNGSEKVVYCDWSAKDQNGAGGRTYAQKLVSGGVALDGGPTVLCDRAMDGGPNADLTWVGQVYDNLWAYDLSTKKEYPTDKFYLLDGSKADHQTCNGSMAPDESARLMTLVIPHDYVRIYSFVAADDSFKETSRFKLPTGATEWEFPEWSTHPDYFTASLRSAAYKLNLQIVKVAEGETVPKTLQISKGDVDISYSHLYLAPQP